jgi:hypothetical protein
MFLWSRARPVLKADSSPPFVSRLSRQCGIFNISQPYRSSQPVTGIGLLYYLVYSLGTNWRTKEMHEKCHWLNHAPVEVRTMYLWSVTTAPVTVCFVVFNQSASYFRISY